MVKIIKLNHQLTQYGMIKLKKKIMMVELQKKKKEIKN
jgi:hypothetical protein